MRSRGRPGRRSKAYREISTRLADTIYLAMHLVYIAFQCGGVDELDRGLLHHEEAMLDESAANGTDPISLRKRAPQQHLDGVGDFVFGEINAASLLVGGEVRLGDPSMERRRIDVLHNQIPAAGSIVEDVVHFGHVEV
jgi:hypothetical protein